MLKSFCHREKVNSELKLPKLKTNQTLKEISSLEVELILFKN